MIQVEEHKELSHSTASEVFRSPKKLYIPLIQHTGKASLPSVAKGDFVQEGQLIAQSTALISSNVHAPAGGKISEIDSCLHPNFKKAPCVILECSDEKKEYAVRKNVGQLSQHELLDIIKNSGIVGMGGAAFPTHVKLAPPKPIDTLIVNGCECEPYLACDYRLMYEHLDDIFKGVEIICKIIHPQQVIFGLEDNKHEVAKKLNLLISIKKYHLPSARMAVLKTAYPQGGEKQLIQAITKRRVPPGKLPLDVGCLVHNVGTIFAIYESVYLGKPLIERLVSFAGDALTAPKNIWVKIGTTLQELFDSKMLRFTVEPKKIICGGPMMGVALDSLAYPILKGTGGFLFLTEQVAEIKEEQTCIRCARCVDTCPMNLLPLEYPKRVKKEEYTSLNDFNISDCIECGCCAYECPAKIPLVHYIKIGKRYLPK